MQESIQPYEALCVPPKTTFPSPEKARCRCPALDISADPRSATEVIKPSFQICISAQIPAWMHNQH